MNELQRLCKEAQAVQAASVQYIGVTTFGIKKVKMELPGKFDGKPSALNTQIFEVEQYCKIVGINSVTDIVKLAITHFKKDAHTWQHQLATKSTDYESSHLGWNQFECEIRNAFSDVDTELKLHRQLSALK